MWFSIIHSTYQIIYRQKHAGRLTDQHHLVLIELHKTVKRLLSSCSIPELEFHGRDLKLSPQKKSLQLMPALL
jgi:hypothetical protein